MAQDDGCAVVERKPVDGGGDVPAQLAGLGGRVRIAVRVQRREQLVDWRGAVIAKLAIE